MTTPCRLGLLALVIAALVGCGQPADPVLPNGDGGSPDGGPWAPDGGGTSPDGGNPHGAFPVLRPTIGIDLSQVSSFAVISGSDSAYQARRGGLAPTDGEQDGGVPTGPQLLALTLTGEVLEVTLAENGNPESSGVIEQPQVSAVYPTPSWILFATFSFNVVKLLDDGSTVQVDCSTIAANRETGKLFCAPLGIRPLGHGDPLYRGVHTNAAGDVAYVASADALNNTILYKVTLSGAEGPTATLVDPALHPIWFLTNAAGDLLVNSFTSLLDQTTTRSQILPFDGSAVVSVQGAHNSYAACGAVGDADENTFYVLNGGGGGFPFDGTILVVSKGATGFVATPQTVTMADVNTCSFLFRLGDGLYMFCGYAKALVRVIADGAVIPDPTPIPLVGVDTLVNIAGTMVHPAADSLVFLATTGSGFMFVRHDGTTQQDIPLDANLDLLRVTFAASGAIEFLAVRTDTQEKVRGTVPAGSTEVTTTAAGVLDPAQVVVFTPIN